MPIDFLIVAALTDEAKEVKRLLKDVHHEADFIVGAVPRWGALGAYTVGLIDLGGMGTNNAQAVIQDVLSIHRPRAVLMTGIAAGFADGPSSVALGDLMVPYGVMPYELAKIGGAQAPVGWRGTLRNLSSKLCGWPSPEPTVEHRGIAWAVAESLWRTAANSP
jgi:nucleoside phosphorylase